MPAKQQGLNTIIMKWLLPVLLVIPVFIVGYHKGHPWGDDFAQYIMQAQNISRGHLTGYTQYVPDSNNLAYAPPAYPAGFPLLLAAFITLSNDHINTLVHWMMLVNVLYLIALYNYLRVKTNVWAASVLLVIACYNSLFIEFKGQVLSDIPFAGFLLLVLWLFEFKRNNKYYGPFLALALCGALLMRSAGIVLVGAVLLIAFIDWLQAGWNKKTAFVSALTTAGWAFLAFGLFFIVEKLLFTSPGNSINNYMGSVKVTHFMSLITQHLQSYAKTVLYIVYYTPDTFKRVHQALGLMLGLLILLGVGRKKVDVFCALYLLTILVWRVRDTRFFQPLWPFVFYYLYVGYKRLSVLIKGRYRWAPALILFMAFMINQLPMMGKYYKQRNNVIPGPYNPSVEICKSYLDAHVPAENVIAFYKPRAMTLILHRPFTQLPWEKDRSAGIESLRRRHINYILSDKSVHDTLVTRIVSRSYAPFAVDSMSVPGGYELYTLHWNKK